MTMTKSKTKTKILLVDDRRENLLALAYIVADPGVEIHTAQSASDALALLLENQYALALIDVQMPEMSGFELARLMRTTDRSRAIPIVFVTASQGERHQVFEGYEHGAVDYLLKPLSAHIVRSKVRVFVELDQKSKALEQELREVESLRAAAESANRAKSRFLANMSHEIRTPLGAVLGFTQLLQIPDQTDEDKEICLKAIERNGQLLLRLVNDVLDLSKIEAEKIKVEKEATHLDEFILDLEAVHAHKALEKGVLLNVTTEGRLPPIVMTDAQRLNQILNNIVGNAVKFTDRGQVTVKISYDVKRRQGQLVFRIEDSGCGLTEADASRIFRPFMQADSSTNKRFGGTGLGLIIAKQLAILLGGDVILSESWPGQGSVFLVSIDPGPIAEGDLRQGCDLLRVRPAHMPGGDLSQRLTGLDGVRVLVVDDAMDNRRLLSRVLVLAGGTVKAVGDGATAIEEIRARADEFDVILMDIQMPGMDGYEVTTYLRRQGYRKPIIALTAHPMKEELSRCLESGFDHHLTKPVNYPRLIKAISEYAARAKAMPLTCLLSPPL